MHAYRFDLRDMNANVEALQAVLERIKVLEVEAIMRASEISWDTILIPMNVSIFSETKTSPVSLVTIMPALRIWR